MEKLLRLSAVIERTGLSRSSIYATPGFPKPVKIGLRSVAWVDHEIRDWVLSRIEDRELAER